MIYFEYDKTIYAVSSWDEVKDIIFNYLEDNVYRDDKCDDIISEIKERCKDGIERTDRLVKRASDSENKHKNYFNSQLISYQVLMGDLPNFEFKKNLFGLISLFYSCTKFGNLYRHTIFVRLFRKNYQWIINSTQDELDTFNF